MSAASKLEDKFYSLWLSKGGPPLERQVMLKEIAPDWPGKHTVDFYHPATHTVIEINGGTAARTTRTTRGRKVAVQMGHNSGPGLRRDYIKSLVIQNEGGTCIALDKKMSTDDILIDRLIAYLTTRAVDAPLTPCYNHLWELQKAPRRNG